MLLWLAACNGPDLDTDEDVVPDAPARIVVYVIVDTLGELAASDAGYCEMMTGIGARYGIPARCLEGGVVPSSWTLESHLRLLWPSTNAGACDHD